MKILVRHKLENVEKWLENKRTVMELSPNLPKIFSNMQ